MSTQPSVKLSELSASIGPMQKPATPHDIHVHQITTDSRQVAEGMVFVAIAGSNVDGHQFLPTVCAQGAAAVVVSDISKVPPWYWGTVIHVANTRVALSRLAACFYGYPSRSLYCVGVTGTNGKTTLTHMVEHILNHAQMPTGVIGTIDHHLMDKVWPSALTTPDPLQLQARLREMTDLGAKALAMEVSSHALDQERASGIDFDCVAYTNLTRDHLDYHGTMENYFQAKQKLFDQVLKDSGKKLKRAVIYGDDPQLSKLRVDPQAELIRYGTQPALDYVYTPIDAGLDGSHFHLRTREGEFEVRLPMPGPFNIANATAAIAITHGAGVTAPQAIAALSHFGGVRGRLQAVPNPKGLYVFVDFAHTDDALENVLSALRPLTQQARIWTVFGCGGDRDPGKRPLMMRAARTGSDVVIVTSDNPRSEDPQKIIADCLSEVSAEDLNRKIFSEVDRRKAIAMALRLAQSGDVVLIAGKGHEDYQIIGTEKRPFSDAAVVRELCAEI